jgi:uncharacterized membrane protein
MSEKDFSIRAVLKEGWELTKVNMGFLFVYQIILYVISILLSGNEGGWKMAPLYILGYIIVILGKMGLYQSILMMTTGNKPGFDQFYRNWPQFFSWVVAGILFGLMFVIGLILLIVPGCYVLARYGLFPFFILDKQLGPLEALKQAGEATEGVRGQLFLLFLACLAVNIVGMLFFLIGLLITVPITLLALATVYRKLTGQEKNSIQPADIGANV